MLGDGFHLDRVAQIRLVRAIFAHGFSIGNARESLVRDFAVVGEFTEQTGQNRLHYAKDLVLGDEAHFHVELIELARRAVGAGVFVPEARCDLEVAIKAGHHDQLFELLRRLGQRIELARMQARRHQEVARAFR